MQLVKVTYNSDYIGSVYILVHENRRTSMYKTIQDLLSKKPSIRFITTNTLSSGTFCLESITKDYASYDQFKAAHPEYFI